MIAVFGAEIIECKRKNMNAWNIHDQSVIFSHDAHFMGRTEDPVYDFIHISN